MYSKFLEVLDNIVGQSIPDYVQKEKKNPGKTEKWIDYWEIPTLYFLDIERLAAEVHMLNSQKQDQKQRRGVCV